MLLMDPYFYIKSLTFNDDVSVTLSEGDIIVFVGSNNVGKSETLRNIYSLMRNQDTNSCLVVKKLAYESTPDFDWLPWYEEKGFCERNENNDFVFHGNGQSGSVGSTVNLSYFNPPTESGRTFFTWFCFVAYIDTVRRLTMVDPQEASDGSIPQTPIENLYFYPEIVESFSSVFQKTFSEQKIACDVLTSKKIILRLGEQFKASSAGQLDSSFREEGRKYYEKLPELNRQGDGMKSFSGIVLSLLFSAHSIALIDEPESFLHPQQAYSLGQALANDLGAEKQIFCSTHSSYFINGLLSGGGKRVKIIRLERIMKEDGREINPHFLLDNQGVADLINEPMILYTKIMDALFSDSVVICESESDCSVYSSLYAYMERSNHKYSECIFLPTNGKAKIKNVVSSLKAFGLKLKAIVDFDFLNDEELVKAYVSVFGGDWANFEANFKLFNQMIAVREDQIKKTEINDKVTNYFAQISGDFLNKSQIKHLAEEILFKDEWDEIKTKGISYFDGKPQKDALRKLLDSFAAIGIFIVPCGELECFVPDVKGHGISWIKNLEDKYHDFSDEAYSKIKEFLVKVLDA